MKTRRQQLLRITGGLAIMALAFGAIRILYTRHVMSTLQKRVETNYSTQISAIEAYMMTSSNIADISVLDNEQILRSGLAAVPEIYSADCSHDGHHGLETLKMFPYGVGFSYRRGPFPSNASPSRRLSSAVALDGTQLLLYNGWLPRAPVYRNYKLFFLRSSIENHAKPDVEPMAAASPTVEKQKVDGQ